MRALALGLALLAPAHAHPLRLRQHGARSELPARPARPGFALLEEEVLTRRRSRRDGRGERRPERLRQDVGDSAEVALSEEEVVSPAAAPAMPHPRARIPSSRMRGGGPPAPVKRPSSATAPSTPNRKRGQDLFPQSPHPSPL